jgi:hypothetical protein
MNPRKILPAILLVIGGLVVATGGRGCDHLPWPLPSPIVSEKHPDAWLVFIEESSDRNIDLAILLQNKKWTDSLAERKINYRVYDQDQEEAKSYKPLLKDLPQLFFVTPDGRVRKQAKSPSTARQADELIAEVLGK